MDNGTIVQMFEWYLPADGLHWKRCEKMAESLKEMGITAVWLPPAYKGTGGARDVGYGVYDTYDLGEFNQKGSIRTKYGTREEYLEAVAALQKQGIDVYADIVLNHRIGADAKEMVTAVEDNRTNRNQQVSEPREIEAWTVFNFPGRHGKYSDFVWSWKYFDGTDWDDDWKYSSVFLFAGKEWDKETDGENGNYDYLMGADLDLGNAEVIAELDKWGQWYYDTVHMDGFRLDAVKHMDFSFYTNWLGKLREKNKKEFFAVGEYWSKELGKLLHYQEVSKHCMSLFDVPLHFRLKEASDDSGNFDMGSIMQDTLAKADPLHAVTFVDNHDTQPGQALESYVAEWFRPLAYALILLRMDGYPCVFWGDLEGIPYSKIEPVPQLPLMIRVRHDLAYGEQHDYLDDSDIIGWTREGDEEHPHSGIAVILSDGPGGSKKMCIGKKYAGNKFYDVLGHCEDPVTIDEDGEADFPVSGGNVSVWITQEAYEKLSVDAVG